MTQEEKTGIIMFGETERELKAILKIITEPSS